MVEPAIFWTQLRAGLATVLYYPQQALLVPVQAMSDVGEYFMGLKRALDILKQEGIDVEGWPKA